MVADPNRQLKAAAGRHALLCADGQIIRLASASLAEIVIAAGPVGKMADGVCANSSRPKVCSGFRTTADMETRIEAHRVNFILPDAL
jgi:hypothetical protein